MMHKLLQIHLKPIARDQRRWRMLRALALLWGTAAALGLIAILIHRFEGWISPWPFLLLVVATTIGSLVIWWRFARQPLNFQDVARKIEAENPKLHALLLTAVEQVPEDGSQELNYLQDRVIREALAEDRRSIWRARAVNRLRLAQLAGVVSISLLGLVLMELYQAAPPRVAVLTMMGREVTVTPGDTSVEKGGSIVVLARFEGEVPSEAVLVVRPANEPERRISLTKNLDDPVYGTSLPGIQAELTYRVEYGDETTREFKVTTFEFPRLERADAKVTYPEYTGLAQKVIEDTRRVSAVEGSRIEYTFHLNKPIQSAALVPRIRQAGERGSSTSATDAPLDAGYQLASDTNRPNVLLLDSVLDRSGRYELILVDDAGRTNKFPPLFVLEALSNRAPDLKFAFPKGDQRVSAIEEMAFKAEVFDDFGLKAYGLAYNLAGEDMNFIELGRSAGPQEKISFEHLVPLEELGAQPDQLMSYFLWAEDIGPDGNQRRSMSDMYFAEVRPFEEIFREAQSQDAAQQQQQQQQGQQGQNAAQQLAELQKQIITATWNLQRRETGESPSDAFKEDAATVKESQDGALEQVRTQMEQVEDPSSRGLLETVATAMESAAEHLGKAADENSTESLPPALSAEQSAYQALLRLSARETQVARNQSGQRGQNQRGSRSQQQLDQLELSQSENRYETESQAAMPMNEQQREQLQAFNRLKELAQRQQDVNERLRELQAALQEARTEEEREELRERLKRLQEEQQQMLADVDELQQRMERPENQAEMAEARQQLEQTREDVQRAAEAMERGEVAQALSSGTRAQRDMEQMREDFRRESSSQFAEDMREMRNRARELAEQQEEIGQELDALDESSQRQTLSDSDEREALANRLEEQRRRMEELVNRATEVTQEAEPVEPLLSQQLYDTLRRASQDDVRNLRETTEDLLMQGRLYRSVYDRLQEAQRESQSPLEVAADLLRGGYSDEADNLEERARGSINNLRSGIEQAAESVLGDEAEALRFARSELDELSRQIERELEQARRDSDTNALGAAQGGLARQGEQSDAENQPGEQSSDPQPQEQQQASAQGGSGNRPGESQEQTNEQAQGEQPGQAGQGGQQGQGRGEQQELASADQQQGGNQGQGGRQDQQGERDGNRRDGGQRGGGSFLDQIGGDRGGWLGGPITGPGFRDWSDRLRDVEELLDDPELRTEAARIRERAAATRQDLRRHAREPQWDLVRMEIAGPLVELRNRVAEELARRESKDAIVPIDRDPVPTRYSELVRRYYEELGKSETASADGAGGVTR